MDAFTTIASGVRAGTTPADVFSDWLLQLPAWWFLVEGEFDDDGQPLNVRPVVVHHPSGATITLVFTDADRAEAYRQNRDDLEGPLAIVSAAPSVAVETLLTMPIDGVTINPGDTSRLNAGRGQVQALADRLAARGA